MAHTKLHKSNRRKSKENTKRYDKSKFKEMQKAEKKEDKADQKDAKELKKYYKQEEKNEEKANNPKKKKKKKDTVTWYGGENKGKLLAPGTYPAKKLR